MFHRRPRYPSRRARRGCAGNPLLFLLLLAAGTFFLLTIIGPPAPEPVARAIATATPPPSRTPPPTATPSRRPAAAPATAKTSPLNVALPNPTHPPPTPTPTVTLRVGAGGANFRTGPGTAYAIRETLAPGSEALVLARTENHAWLKVRTTDGREGWLSIQVVYLLENATTDALPVLVTMPPPK